MPKSQAYIGHLMILSTTFIYSFNTNFMKVIIPEWIGPNGLVTPLLCQHPGFLANRPLFPDFFRSSAPPKKRNRDDDTGRYTRLRR